MRPAISEMKDRKKLFDTFISKARSFGWAGSTAPLWTAWKIIVWPKIRQNDDALLSSN